MSKSRKTLIRGTFILIMSLSLIVCCGGKYSHKIAFSKKSETSVISASEFKKIMKSGEISIADNSPASSWWLPKNRKITLYEVMSWLKQSKQYKRKIPKSQFLGVFHGNIGPSTLCITTLDNHEIKIQPAFYLASKDGIYSGVGYITNVLQMNNDKQKSYIQCTKLFNWLKNDTWKIDFEMRH